MGPLQPPRASPVRRLSPTAQVRRNDDDGNDIDDNLESGSRYDERVPMHEDGEAAGGHPALLAAGSTSQEHLRLGTAGGNGEDDEDDGDGDDDDDDNGRSSSASSSRGLRARRKFPVWPRHAGEWREVWARCLQRKSMAEAIEVAKKDDVHKVLNAMDLTALGIGAIIGTGIFVLTGTAAANNAGPAVVLSFAIAGWASAFAGLCYAELASVIPVSGSAYTYAYVCFGELVAWIIGWDLILEYAGGCATVAVGFSAYLNSFFESIFGVGFPVLVSRSPMTWDVDAGIYVFSGSLFDLPAVLFTLVVTGLLVFGIQESATVNKVIVVFKIAVILLFLFFAMGHVNSENWSPFIPPNTGRFGEFGVSGIFQGATTVFFAYIGFDAVSTTALECRNPQRDMPIGILASLSICTLLYIAVAFVTTGLVPYRELNVASPISYAIAKIPGLQWLTIIISLGALAGLASVMLVGMMAQPRIFYSMAQDGLLPASAARLHPRFKTPVLTTLITGVVCAVAAGVLPIEFLGELTSIGTLLAFVIVCLGVMLLRIRQPDLPRKFRVPGGPYVVPLLGAASSAALIVTATVPTLVRLIVWMAVGLLVYFFYGRHRSKLGSLLLQPDEIPLREF